MNEMQKKILSLLTADFPEGVSSEVLMKKIGTDDYPKYYENIGRLVAKGFVGCIEVSHSRKLCVFSEQVRNIVVTYSDNGFESREMSKDTGIDRGIFNSEIDNMTDEDIIHINEQGVFVYKN